MLDVNDSIILACASREGALPTLAAQETGLARVAVSRRIKKLADSGHLLRHGSGTRQTYSLGAKRFALQVHSPAWITERGGEMAQWEMHMAPLLRDLPASVQSLANTAFTEMLNNALDHADAQNILTAMHLDAGRLQLVVADDGVGIFNKIAAAAGWFDPRLALLELAKGKFTSASAGHSGMGVFVASRMMDGFCISSGSLRFDPHEARSPLAAFAWWEVPAWLTAKTTGTVVRMDIATDSPRKPNDVYFKYFDPQELGGDAFHTTEIPVRLAQLSSHLVSRSQGKWVMDRASQFKTVILDFDGVVHVGQAFVDEVFRVFAAAHPQVQLKTMNLTPEVAHLVHIFGGPAPG